METAAQFYHVYTLTDIESMNTYIKRVNRVHRSGRY